MLEQLYTSTMAVAEVLSRSLQMVLHLTYLSARLGTYRKRLWANHGKAERHAYAGLRRCLLGALVLLCIESPRGWISNHDFWHLDFL